MFFSSQWSTRWSRFFKNIFSKYFKFLLVYTDVQKFQINQEVIVHQEGDDNEENLTGVGRIVGITEHLCATVDFLDGTISGDLFLGEIRNCECKWFGCSGGSHIPGSLVFS